LFNGAVVSLALAIGSQAAPGLSIDRAPRQGRAGSVRTSTTGSQRTGANGIEIEVPEAALDPIAPAALLLVTRTNAARHASDAPAAAALVRPATPDSPLHHPAGRAPVAASSIVRSRSHAPTRGRAPPLL
jgi:hypothetical protein